MDPGRIETDKKLYELEQKIKKIYSEAEEDLRKKLKKYFESYEKKDKIKREQVDQGILDPNTYKQWKVGQLAVGKRWEAMLKNISDDLANAEKIAKSITNEYMPEVYAINMNYATYAVEKDLNIDTSFVLYNRETVENLIREDPEILPPPGKQMQKKINSGTAEKWRKGQIQSVTLQTILQGESIPNMAKRISKNLCVDSRRSAIRYARTATTNAENAGRLDSFHRMEDKGIKLKKTWVAVLDGRTRDAHRELDGQTVELDKPFKNSIGKIMRPGDPTADGANVWNCRCGMISQIDGFETDVTDMSLRNTSKLDGMSYEEWKKGKKAGTDKPDVNTAQGSSFVNHPEPGKHLDETMSKAAYNQWSKQLQKAPEEVSKLQDIFGYGAQYINSTHYKPTGYYNPLENKVVYDLNVAIEDANKFHILNHENGHMYDYNIDGNIKDIGFEEFKAIQNSVGLSAPARPSQSDTFLNAMRDDMERLSDIIFSDNWKSINEDLLDHFSTSGVQDFLDGAFGGTEGMPPIKRIYGHGNEYYDRVFNGYVNDRNIDRILNKLADTDVPAYDRESLKATLREHETASELWANITAALSDGGEEEAYMRKFAPNAVNAFMNIIGRI